MLNQYTRIFGLVGLAAMMFAIAQGPPYQLKVPPGFPPPPLPPDNRLTTQGVALGQRLFSERRLSGNNTQSCADCHHPNMAFSDEGKAVSVGSTGKKGTRNAPALFNLIYQHTYFWDGRSPTLRAQALVPIQNPVEMNSTLAQVVSKLTADSTYVSQFNAAFGPGGVTSARVGLALEQYEITLLDGYSKYDLYLQGKAQLTQQELRGLTVFRTPFNPQQGLFGGDCARCHGGPLMSDFAFRNNGLDTHPADPGREDVTGLASDYGKFKTPSVRNLTSSGPYMHDGRFATLAQVVQHYSSGILPSTTLDPGLAREQGGVHLSPADQAALVAFLQTLTDPPFRPNVGP
jgi:cytochrome c peroxidase